MFHFIFFLFCFVDIALLLHAPQRMNAYVLADPLTLPVAQFVWCNLTNDISGPKIRICVLIVTTFGAHVAQGTFLQKSKVISTVTS